MHTYTNRISGLSLQSLKSQVNKAAKTGRNYIIYHSKDYLRQQIIIYRSKSDVNLVYAGMFLPGNQNSIFKKNINYVAFLKENGAEKNEAAKGISHVTNAIM